jgi:hypothetical protein
MTLYCKHCRSFGLSVEIVTDRPDGGCKKQCNCPTCGGSGAYIEFPDGSDRLTGCLAMEDYNA